MMMEASIESGRTPLQGDNEAQNNYLSRQLTRRSIALWILLAVDFVCIPLTLVLAFDFNFAALLESQAAHFSLASSFLDWVIFCIIRDIWIGILVIKAQRHGGEAACGHMRVARRIAMGLTLYALGRLTLIDSNDFATAALVETLLVSGFMLIAISVACYMLLRTFVRIEEERVKASGEGETNGNAADTDAPQYSSKLSYLGTLKVMKPYFWPSTGTMSEVCINRTRALSTWLCVAGSKSMNLVSPLFLAQATNGVARAIKEHQENPSDEVTIPKDVIMNLCLYGGFIFMSKALKECQEIVYIKVQQAAYIEIADNTFAHLHTLSLDWHLRKKMGNVVRSMDRGIAAAQSTMKYCFLYLLPTLCECFAVAMIFLFKYKNVQLCIFMLLNLFAYCYITVKITLWRKKFRTATTKHDNELHDRLTDSLVNYETIKYFTAEEYERKEYTNIVTKFQQMSMATQYSLSILNTVQQGIINFTLAGGMILACSQFIADGSVGQFVAVNMYIVQTFAPLSFLGTIYNMVINAIVDMASFGQLLAETGEVSDDPGAKICDSKTASTFPMVEFRNVSFHYRTQPLERSIQNISFSTLRGSTTALVGTTGSGKTTCTRLLFRFYDPIHGKVLLNGQDVRSCTQKSVREAIGFVPQDVVMFNASIEHNIKYGCIENCTQEQVQKAAEQAQLSRFIDQQPQGYETMVGERGLKLSGGEKQRLAIARCLVKNPPIVVLDEATSALDSATEQKIQEALNVLSTSRTVIAIAHRLSTIRHFNEVLVLEGGQIVQRGTHDELVAIEGGKYAQMWNHQGDIGGAGIAIDADPESAAGLGMDAIKNGTSNGNGHAK